MGNAVLIPRTVYTDDELDIDEVHPILLFTDSATRSSWTFAFEPNTRNAIGDILSRDVGYDTGAHVPVIRAGRLIVDYTTLNVNAWRHDDDPLIGADVLDNLLNTGFIANRNSFDLSDAFTRPLALTNVVDSDSDNHSLPPLEPVSPRSDASTRATDSETPWEVAESLSSLTRD